MLTEEEQRFLEYWAKNRDREKKLFRQLVIGLPVGLIFAIPIIINFSAGWYKRADMWARSHADEDTGVVLIIAVLVIAVFVAIFYKKHRWDMYEQQYQELLARRDGGSGEKHAPENPPGS